MKNKAFSWFRKTIPKLVDDILLVAGMICIAIGFFCMYPPAGWVVIGIECIAIAILLAKFKKNIRQETHQGGDGP